ncbi:MAG: hypothetical protein QN137_12790, partial [Armatimonadota bacterium]|nr:hypothetical protein [Armatimonadota bacterium]
MTRLRRPTIVLLAALLVAALLPLRAVAAPSVEAAEIQAGRQAAQQIESRYKLVTDEAAVARVARIGAVVAAQTPRPHLP